MLALSSCKTCARRASCRRRRSTLNFQSPSDFPARSRTACGSISCSTTQATSSSWTRSLASSKLALAAALSGPWSFAASKWSTGAAFESDRNAPNFVFVYFSFLSASVKFATFRPSAEVCASHVVSGSKEHEKLCSVRFSRILPRLSPTSCVCRDTEALQLHWLRHGRPRVAAWWYRRGADLVVLD